MLYMHVYIYIYTYILLYVYTYHNIYLIYPCRCWALRNRGTHQDDFNVFQDWRMKTLQTLQMIPIKYPFR